MTPRPSPPVIRRRTAAPLGHRMPGRHHMPGRHRLRGVVLIITLVLLAVIAISSALAMRLSLFGNLVGQNVRAQNLALQAAEAGLRHCEGLVVATPATTPMQVGDGGAPGGSEWRLEANWTGVGQTVPAAQLAGGLGAGRAPQCLIRHLTIDEYRAASAPTPGAITAESRGIDPESFVFYRITARGYSPDFRPGDTGSPAAGAEVWLQSMVRAIR